MGSNGIYHQMNLLVGFLFQACALWVLCAYAVFRTVTVFKQLYLIFYLCYIDLEERNEGKTNTILCFFIKKNKYNGQFDQYID